MAEVQFYKVAALPADLCPNSWYIVMNGDYAETYVTTNNSIPKLVGNSQMIQEVISSYITSYSNIFVVGTIPARDAIAPTTPTLVYVTGLSKAYIWGSGVWYDITKRYVESVTGLNTDNTDPFNPIVKVSVDGTTITGLGTPASPLVSNSSIGPQGPTGATGAAGSTGPQGIQGPQGISGNTGIAGSQGIQGTQGPIGLQGQLGPQGIQGLSAYQVWLLQGGVGDVTVYLASLKGQKGDKGDIGATGAIGAKGSRGDTGSQGIQGIQGNDGPAGSQGNDGLDGAAGIQGPIGPQGIQGEQGDDGEQGIQGDPGTSVTIKGSVATASDLAAVTGMITGDGYITADTGHLWVYNGTSFIDVGLVRGPAGANGATGAQGPIGPAGATGPIGPAGANGATGATGAAGPSGSLTVNGEYPTQDAAIADGLVAGEVYRLPYTDYNRHLAIVEEAMPDATFYFGDTTIPITSSEIVAGQPGITAHNATAVVNYTNTSDQYLWYAERITENEKDTWFNTIVNNGPIGPGELFLSPTVIDGIWRLYVSAYESKFVGSCQFRSTTTGGGGGGTGGAATYVTGLNTDNSDPANPVVKISVDGSTVTGLGTPASPLISHSSYVYNLPTASNSILGGVKVGTGLSIASGVLSADPYSLATASSSVLGGIKVGSGLIMTAGTLSVMAGTSISLTTTGTNGLSTLISNVLNIPNYTYTLPVASVSVSGGVKVGTGLSISSGILAADPYLLPVASASVSGGIKVGSGLSISSGVLSATGGGGSSPSLTTTGTSGLATLISNVLNIPNYTYSLPTASVSVSGGIKVGAGLNITAGVLSADIASGIYTPTYANITNSTSVLARQCQYSRVGNVVTVSGAVQNWYATTNGLSSISLTLPITSAFGSSYDAGGTGAGISNNTMYTIVVSSLSGNNKVSLSLIADTAITTVGIDCKFSFTYRII